MTTHRCINGAALHRYRGGLAIYLCTYFRDFGNCSFWPYCLNSKSGFMGASGSIIVEMLAIMGCDKKFSIKFREN